MRDYFKRFSVDVGGRILAVFDSIEDAQEWISSHWWVSIATITDHESHDIIYTEINII